MFILKKNIQKIIDKSGEDGFNKGVDYASDINEIEQRKMRSEHEKEILLLKSDLNIEKLKYKKTLSMQKDSIEKSRLAEVKEIQAMNAILKVQQVIDIYSDNSVRAKADISQLLHDLDKPIKKIMKDDNE